MHTFAVARSQLLLMGYEQIFSRVAISQLTL